MENKKNNNDRMYEPKIPGCIFGLRVIAFFELIGIIIYFFGTLFTVKDIADTVWISFIRLILGIIFYFLLNGFAEIIDILDDIRKKLNKNQTQNVIKGDVNEKVVK